MEYSAKYRSFVDDKCRFFTTVNSTAQAKQHANNQSFDFLSNNNLLITEEFRQLFSILQQDKHNRKEFWLYCYYCCVMLQNYYIAYDHPAKSEEYKKLQQKLQAICEEQELDENLEQDSFILTLGNTFMDDIEAITSAPQHLSQLRNWVAFTNLCRFYWAFCRMTLTNAYKLAKDTKWIEFLNKLLKKKIDVDAIIKTLEAPSGILRAMSVGIFVVRLLMNVGMILKHTLFPSDEEKEIKWTTRFTNELWKRHPDLLNDIVWATVNGLSNYAGIFHIAAPVAPWLAAGFLFFDIGLIIWRRHLAKQEYLEKKSQYLFELQNYQNLFRETDNLILQQHYEKQCAMLLEQLTELEIIWKTKNATFLFSTIACCLLAGGVTASLLFTPGILVVASLAICTLAPSMFFSEGAYSSYKEKSLRLEQAQVTNKNEKAALKYQG